MQITKEHISVFQEHGACSDALDWLREQPRTWRELVEHESSWAIWAMFFYPDCPINACKDALDRLCEQPRMVGLSSEDWAWVMAKRPDCPIGCVMSRRA